MYILFLQIKNFLESFILFLKLCQLLDGLKLLMKEICQSSAK